MSKGRLLLLLFGVVCLVCIGANTSGAAVTFTGSSSGTWSNPVSAQASPFYTGVGISLFTWGAGGDPSSVSFTGTPFSVDEGVTFQVGDLTYYNGSIETDSGVDAVDLDLLLTITDPFAGSESFAFTFTIFDTINTSDPWESADYLYLPSSYPQNTFNYGGTDYTLKLLGFSQDSGATVVDTFHVLEQWSTEAELFAQITSPPPAVPEPTTLLLVGGGLAGLAGLRRKMKG